MDSFNKKEVYLLIFKKQTSIFLLKKGFFKAFSGKNEVNSNI